MEFLNCSYGKEFYQSTLKHVACKTVSTKLSGGNAPIPVECSAVRWPCGGGMASIRPGLPVSRPGGVANVCPRLFGGRGRETDPVRPHGRAASRRCLPSDDTVKAACLPCGFNGG